MTCFCSLVFSCKPKEKVSEKSQGQSDTVLLASIERTPCFGRCPTYKIKIFQSGYVVYDGKQNVTHLGLFETRLPKEQVQQVKEYIVANRIYDLNDEYTNPRIADFPSVITEVNLDGKYKRIVNTEPRAPESLKAFEKFLDSFFDENTQWQQLPGRD